MADEPRLLDLNKLGGSPDVSGNAFAGSHIDPDEAATAVRTERETGVPASVARGSEVPKEPRMLNLGALKSSKAVADYAGRSPEHASVVGDDAEHIGGLPGFFRSVKSQFQRDVVGPSIDTYLAIKSGLAASDAAIISAMSIPLGLAGQAVDPLVGTVLPENAPAKGEALLLNKAAEYSASAEAQLRPVIERQRGMGKDVMAGWQSLFPSVTGAALTAITKRPAFGLSAAGGQAGGQAYQEGREAGLAPTDASMYGLGSGVAEAATEMLPAIKLVKDLVPGTSLYKMLMGQLVTEIPGEQAATLIQDLNQWAYINPDKTLQEFLDERPDAARQTLVATLLTSTAQTAAIHTTSQAVDEMAALKKRRDMAEKASDAKAYAEGMAEMAKATKMLGRDPHGLSEILTGAAGEHGAPDKFYIDSEDMTGLLLQEGKTINDLADMLPSFGSQIVDGYLAGGSIEIPAGEFAVAVAGDNPLAQTMLDHVRTEADGFSVEQARQFKESYDAKQLENADKILSGYKEGDQFRQEAAAIRQQVAQELVDSGRMGKEAAETNARLTEAFFVNAARDWGNGMTPGKLFERIMQGRRVVTQPRPVEAGSVYSAGQQFDQQTGQIKTETPEFKGWSGDAPVVSADQADGYEFKTGSPVAVEGYHGTNKDIESFDPSLRGQNTQAESARNGFFASSDSVTSGSYANYAAMDARIAVLVAEAEKAEKAGDWDTYDAKIVEYEALDASFSDPQNRMAGQNILPVYMSMKNPLVVDAAGENAVGFDIAKAVKQAVRGKYDGLIIKNLDDAAGISNRPATHFVVFEPTQIKSKFNRGTFDPNDPNILRQGDYTPRTYEEIVKDETRAARGEGSEGGTPADRGTVARGGETGAAADLGGEYHQPAYRGSPYRFDKFSLEHLGKGEGAQAYGWGLYFASEIDVAKFYTPRDLAHEEKMMREYQRAESRGDYAAMEVWEAALQHKTASEIESEYSREDTDPDVAAASKKVAAWLRKNKSKKGGQLYRVEIPSDDQYLLWDKPVPEETVRKIAEHSVERGLVDDVDSAMEMLADEFDASGAKMYGGLSEQLGSDEAASKFLNEIGIAGIKYLDGTSRADGDGSYNYVIFDDNAVQVLETYYQQNKGPLGTFNPATLAITLNKTSNLSTFLHESGHAFLDITMMMAREPDAPQSVKDRADAILKWLGVPATPEMSGVDAWLGMTVDQKREYHEKWAETFEQYLMKGQAPSLELAEAFARFRDWMLAIYKSIRGMLKTNTRAKLDSEVQQIFDRMLATDQQITEAKAARSIIPLFSKKPQNMTPEQWRAYQDKLAAGDDHARHVIDKEKINDMQWIRARGGKLLKQMQKDAKEKRKEAKIEARRRILSQPAYIARQILTGKVKAEPKAKKEKASKYLAEVDPTRDSAIIAIAKMGGMNEAAFVAEYGIDPADFQEPEMRAGHKRPAIVKKGGLSPGEVGEALAELGYLPTDEHGKWDNNDLEALLDDEARGNSRYSLQADYSAIEGGDQFSKVQQLDEYGFGAARLQRDEVNARFGGIDGIEAIDPMVADAGMPADYIAEVAGFQSGDDMVRGLIGTKDINEAIEEETDRIMLERHGDIESAAALERAVNAALSNAARSHVIASELKIIAKGVGSSKRTVAAARDAAREIISGIKVADLRPERYSMAAARASRMAADAMAHGDDVAAAKHKRTELLNNELFRLATEHKAAFERKIEKFGEMLKGKDEDVAKRRNMDLVKIVRATLNWYGIGTEAQAVRAEHYMALLAEYNPTAAADVSSIAGMLPDEKPYKQLTVSEFQGLADAIDGMWQVAKNDKVLTLLGKKIHIDKVAKELVDAIKRIKGGQIPVSKLMGSTPTKLSKTMDGLRGVKAMLLRVEQWADRVGPEFVEHLFRPVSAAVTAHRNWRVPFLRKYRDLLKAHEKNLTSGAINAKEIGFVFAGGKVELLHAILHTGNNSNKRKLLLGRKWATEDGGVMDTSRWDAFVDRMIREKVLTKADYDFAQGVWDLLEEMKPEAQKAHHQMFGYYFDEITANPVQTPFGVYRGGYVPAVADRTNPDIAPKVEADELLHAGNSFMFPTTGKGFTKSRVEFNKPLELDLRAIGQHIDKVSRFVNIEPTVRDIARLTMRDDVREAIEAMTPGAMGQMITPWLQRSARQSVSRPGANRAVDAFWRHMREKSGLTTMLANIVNVAQQVTGFSVAAIKVPAPALGRALWAYSRSPRTVAADIANRSPWMRDRLTNQSMEMQAEIDKIITGKGLGATVEHINQFFRHHGYFLQTAVQNQMDVVVWQATYDHALSKGADEAGAVYEADSAVRTTQGTFAPEDVAAFEVGTPFARSFFQFAGYFNMLANTMGGENAKAVRDMGYGRATPRLLYVYLLGMMIPAVVGQLIASGAPDDEDDEDGDGLMDEWLSLFFMSQVSTAAAMVPGVGAAAMTVLNSLDSKVYNDRLNVSPSLSLAERVVSRSVKASISLADGLAEDGDVVDQVKKQDVKDALTLVSLVTGIPTGQVGKTAGYMLDVQQGKAYPESTLDYVGGLVRGR